MFKGLFSYESKLFQFFVLVGNWIVLNILYLACCIPIFTIGAAGTGMMNACRVLQDPEDDTSCIRAFFRGFSNGFLKISIIWSLFMIVIAVMAYVLVGVIYFDAIHHSAPVVCAVIAIAGAILMQSMSMAFHSRFDCSAKQIVRNGWFMVMMHPIRSIGLAVLIWLPAIVALLDIYLFIQMTPAWLFLYYGAAYQGCAYLVRAPFRKVEELCFGIEKGQGVSDNELLNDENEEA